jgi:hypothetical protein
MSAYTNASDWCQHIGGIRYAVTQPLTWYVGNLETGAEYKVPFFFTFDGSIPRFARFIFSPHNPKYLKAFCLHDYFLSIGWDRFTAGAQFHEALKADGVSRLSRIVMSLGVLFFKYQ